MSSTTSVCDCDDYSYRGLPGNMQEPWCEYYQNIGQPLVYYARVEPSSRSYRSGVKKGSPNFFVKAFRWYTQEHHPQACDQSKTDTPDFASWLDCKYGQYMQEGKMSQHYTSSNCQVCGQHEPNVISTCVVETQKSKRRFATMKSHFKKRKNSKGKSSCHKSSNSCEYITQPIKQISATASEHRRGNIKVVRSDTLGDRKSTMKSPSMTTSRMIDIDYQKSVEVVVTEGAIKERKETCSCTKTEILTIYENKNDSKIHNVSEKQFSCNDVVRKLDVECQCSKLSVMAVNAQTQYDENINASTVKPQPKILPQQEAKIPNNGSKISFKHGCYSRTSIHSQKNLKNVPCPNGICNISTTQPRGAKHVEGRKVPSRQVTRATDISCQCTSDYKPRNEFPCLCANEFEVYPVPEVTPAQGAKATKEVPCPCLIGNEASSTPGVAPVAMAKTTKETLCSCPIIIEPPIPEAAPISMAKQNDEIPCPCRTKTEPDPIPEVVAIPTVKSDAANAPPCPCPCTIENVPDPVSGAAVTPATITSPQVPKTSSHTSTLHPASTAALVPSVPTVNECPCTRSFQDAVRTICQQNKTCERKQQDQILVVPPMVINVLPPRSNSVVTVKSLCPARNKVNEIIQTSDHSICLEDGVTKYPYFMKIVRADRLVIESCTK